jgi:hypothetical protein
VRHFFAAIGDIIQHVLERAAEGLASVRPSASPRLSPSSLTISAAVMSFDRCGRRGAGASAAGQ